MKKQQEHRKARRAMKKTRIAREVKEQIINRIKNDCVTVKQASEEHGIPESTIHTWLARRAEGQPSFGDIIKESLIGLANHYITDLKNLTKTGNSSVGLKRCCAPLHNHPRPEIFHSDNGSEYDSNAFVQMLSELNVKISRSKPGCPWENGY